MAITLAIISADAPQAGQSRGERVREDVVEGQNYLSTTSNSNKDSSKTDPNNKKTSVSAAITRSFFGTLAFLFKRPIRLFRPVKISTWTGIQAIAEEQGRAVTPSFVRNLVRKEGWRFFPHHILPPLVVNTAIGLTLFSVYTTAENRLTPAISNTFSPNSASMMIPFLSGTLAGAAQSIISAPLDNARLILLRRQRFLRQHGRKLAGSPKHGMPFSNWWSLMRDAVFSSPELAQQKAVTNTNLQSLNHRARLNLARAWAKRAWSLFGLSTFKDGISFGVFFTVFELGRKSSRQFGLFLDGIHENEAIEKFDWDEEGNESIENSQSVTKKRRRSAISLILQSFGILLSGAIAGLCFAIVARPFERARAAIYEGRAKWAETISTLQAKQERAQQIHLETVRRGRRKTLAGNGTARRDSGRRAAVRIQHQRKRGLGRFFMRAKRRKLKKRVIASKRLNPDKSATSHQHRLHVNPLPATPPPMPSAFSLMRRAAAQHGLRNFYFSPLPELRRRIASAKKPLHPPVTATQSTPKSLAGPTRLSRRGKEARQAVQATNTGWRRGLRLLAYIPPYAVGFFAYSLMSGDLT